jgi:hypothetical protein
MRHQLVATDTQLVLPRSNSSWLIPFFESDTLQKQLLFCNHWSVRSMVLFDMIYD